MILVCPFCGKNIPEVLINGIAGCDHCNRVFESNIPNNLLAASWMVRKNKYHGISELISDTKISEPEAILVYSLVEDNCYSHDEFQAALKKLGIV